MDIRTTRRVIKDYLEEFKGHLERSEVYVPDEQFRITDKKYYVIEVAERGERIIATRKVAVEELSGEYGVALSGLNR